MQVANATECKYGDGVMPGLNLLPRPQFFLENALPHTTICGQGKICIKWPHPDVINVNSEDEDEDEAGDDKKVTARGNANQIPGTTDTPPH